MNAAPLILIVEDEPALRGFLRPVLASQSFQVVEAADGAEALQMAHSHNPDLVLLDLGLPDKEGLQVLRELRTWFRRPILILSARNQEREKVAALDAGADDYITKPFGANELLARIRVALRHTLSQATAQPLVECGALRIDLEARLVHRQGVQVQLTPLEYRLLAALAQRADKVVTQAQLLTEVWGPHRADQTHYLRIYMGQLRQKLEEDSARPRHLITEPGIGYRLRTTD